MPPPHPPPWLTHPPTNPPTPSVRPSLHGVVASPNQGPYLVPGEPPREGEPGRLRQGPGEMGGHGQGRPPQPPPARPAPRSLSRQDTFDSETPGSRDSAGTEPGDSCCMDIETDPGEEELSGPPGAGPRVPPGHQHRAKGQDRYCPDPPETLDQSDAEGWGQDAYIR